MGMQMGFMDSEDSNGRAKAMIGRDSFSCSTTCFGIIPLLQRVCGLVMLGYLKNVQKWAQIQAEVADFEFTTVSLLLYQR
jgi:hypothetical protein